jgi:hypothetical protein
MCGIYGAIAPQGRQINLGIIHALTWANRERGTDSCGFFDSSGRMTKRAGDPSEVLCQSKVQKWLRNSRESSWFIAGHTRFATRGKVNRANSHPFRYGRIIGSHNGMVTAPAKFTVDSEYLFWALNKARGDYNKALGNISGYWGLSWYDGTHFYLGMHNGELAIVEVEGVYYYSSNWKHLDSCTGGDSKTFVEAEVWKFGPDGVVGTSKDPDSGVPAFKIASKEYWTNRYSEYGTYEDTSSWRSRGSGHTRNRASGGRGGPGKKASADWWQDQDVDSTVDSSARDYDQEWTEAWVSYCSDDGDTSDDAGQSAGSIHGMTDEEFAANEHYAG